METKSSMQWHMSKVKKRAEHYFQLNLKEEWEMVQEMFNTLADEQEEE